MERHMRKLPTRSTMTIEDYARIGSFWDSYLETYRTPDRDGTPGHAAYLAARRIIAGTPQFDDVELVFREYADKVMNSFTKSGKLKAFVRINAYASNA